MRLIVLIVKVDHVHEKQCQKAINKSYLQEIIIQYFGTENIGTANELCDFILNNRQIEY